MITVYEYDGCGSCKKALKWLNARKIEYRKVPIIETPPRRSELERMFEAVGSMPKLFNTSGVLYREMKLGERLGLLSRDEAFSLLATHGKLVKRPFVLGPGVALVGFNEAAWDKAF